MHSASSNAALQPQPLSLADATTRNTTYYPLLALLCVWCLFDVSNGLFLLPEGNPLIEIERTVLFPARVEVPFDLFGLTTLLLGLFTLHSIRSLSLALEKMQEDMLHEEKLGYLRTYGAEAGYLKNCFKLFNRRRTTPLFAVIFAAVSVCVVLIWWAAGYPGNGFLEGNDVVLTIFITVVLLVIYPSFGALLKRVRLELARAREDFSRAVGMGDEGREERRRMLDQVLFGRKSGKAIYPLDSDGVMGYRPLEAIFYQLMRFGIILAVTNAMLFVLHVILNYTRAESGQSVNWLFLGLFASLGVVCGTRVLSQYLGAIKPLQDEFSQTYESLRELTGTVIKEMEESPKRYSMFAVLACLSTSMIPGVFEVEQLMSLMVQAGLIVYNIGVSILTAVVF